MSETLFHGQVEQLVLLDLKILWGATAVVKKDWFVLTWSFQKSMDIQGSVNLGQKCPDISHGCVFFRHSLGDSAHAFIPLVVREKVLITSQHI